MRSLLSLSNDLCLRPAWSICPLLSSPSLYSPFLPFLPLRHVPFIPIFGILRFSIIPLCWGSNSFRGLSHLFIFPAFPFTHVLIALFYGGAFPPAEPSRILFLAAAAAVSFLLHRLCPTSTAHFTLWSILSFLFAPYAL